MRAFVCLGLLAFALAGCGGGDSDTSSSAIPSVTAPTGSTGASTGPAHPAGPADAKQIRSAITAVLAGGNLKAACGTAVTARYIEGIYGDEETCRQSQGPGSAATSVKISAIRISGNTATATAVPKGGVSNGEKTKVILIKQGGAWKLDSQRSNAPVGP